MGANTAVIFGGRRAKLLSVDGLLRTDGSISDFDGAINPIANGHFEVNTKGWLAYQNTPGVVPVTGAGGSPAVSIARSLVAPLQGYASGVLTKDANNRQGEGYAYEFTAPESMLNQTLEIGFDYKHSIGYIGGAPEFVNIYIYDVTNAVIITPNTVLLPNVAANGSFSATFAAGSGTVYRLCFHIAGTGAAAWTINIDNVGVRKFSTSNAPVVAFANRAQLLTTLGLLRFDGSVGDFEGAVNAIPNGHFEIDTNGWATYADAPGPAPVDGTGGAPVITLTRSTAAPLVGVANGRITKDANNRQGEGASYDFTLPAGLEGTECSIEAIVRASANYTGPTGSEVVAAYIYDVTNAAVITPRSSAINGSGHFSVNFLSASNSTSYRLIFHIADVGILSWTMDLDDIRVGIGGISTLDNVNIRAAEGGGTITLTSYDNQGQVFDLSGAEVVLLPTANVKKGDVYNIAERGNAFDLSVQASDASLLEIIRNTEIKLVALVDTPVANTDWALLRANDAETMAIGPDADTTLTSGAARLQLVTPTTLIARIYTLPTTGVRVGESFSIKNLADYASSFPLEIKSSNGDSVAILNPGMTGKFAAVIATPTTSSDWVSLVPTAHYKEQFVPFGSAVPLVITVGTAVASVSLPEGDWDMTLIGQLAGTDSGLSVAKMAISTTAGNMGSGLGNDSIEDNMPVAGVYKTALTMTVRVQIPKAMAPQTWYMNLYQDGGTDYVGWGKIAARRAGT